MPFGSVTLVPGTDTESTPTASQAGINLSNLVRWKQAIGGIFAEKLGGWQRFYQTALTGVPRDLHAWQDLSSVSHLSVATTLSLNIITNGTNQIVTPQTTTTDSPLDFSTSTGSPTITIVDANIANPTVNNSVFFDTPVSVGGIILSGLYPIDTIASPTSYTITADDNATAAVVNGGALPLFATSSGSVTFTVTFNDHGESIGETAVFLVSTTVGGIPISGPYLVQTVADANNYTVNAALQATSTATGYMNGGNVRLTYYIGVGPSTTSAGYGTGGYGDGGYGTGVAPPSGTGTPITATDWTQDNWGEVLLSCPTAGPIFQWSPNGGFQTANIIPEAPIANTGIFVAMPQQILVAFGSSVSGFDDPLQVRWSDSEDYANWTPSSSSFAGSFHIPTGSKIIGGMQAPQQGLIWTDIDIWSMQYINLPDVFGFTKIMSGCGLMGLHAMAQLGSAVLWMSQRQFFMLPAGGAPRILPCSVWDAVFQNLNTSFVNNIRAGTNSAFNEVWWHYPSLASTSGENDSYVKVTLIGGTPIWDCGQLPTGRAAWIDQSVLGTPIGADPTGLIFQHEMTYNGDGAALNPFMQSGYWVIGEGEEFAFVDQFIPDFRTGTYAGSQDAAMLVTLYSVDYPNGAITTYGPFAASEAVEQIACRVRGRQMAARFETQDANSFWRLGKPRFRWGPAGRR